MLKNIVAIWFALLAIFFPLPYSTFPFHTKVIKFLFFPICDSISRWIGLETEQQYFISDGIHLHVLACLLFIVAVTIIIFTQKWHFQKLMIELSAKISIYFVALILFKYGFMKVFKQQFYLPEPNILATRFGDLDKDILYWSTMGTSRIYSIFLGLSEIIAAALLAFRKSRFFGLLLAFGILINIWMVNIGFNIGVKLLSTLLLTIVLKEIFPYLVSIYKSLNEQKPYHHSTPVASVPFWAKVLILTFFLFESLGPSIANVNFNDDLDKRPSLHGWYHSLSVEQSNPINIFFHRDQYYITEDIDGEMESRAIDYINNNTIYFNEPYSRPIIYQLNGDTLILNKNHYLKSSWRSKRAISKDWNWIAE